MSNSPASFPILIFADGASSGNPGPGGWGAVVVLPEGEVAELGGAEDPSTNNRMELTAVIRALDAIRERAGPVDVYTDSVYVIRGITQWIWAWRRRGWVSADGKDVANPELWKQLSAIVGRRGKENPIEWKYVRGHSGIPGNERVDQIAVAFSKGQRISLYRGPLLQYGVAIHDIPEDTSVPEMKPRNNEPKKTAHSYVSLVGGTPMRHQTWPECERRVKGQPGAKFKKAMSAEEESAILRSWGIDPRRLSPSSND